MTDSVHRRHKELLGAYVLGHLRDEGEREVRAHLETCASCRAEVEELAGVVAALSAYPAGGGIEPDTETGQRSPSPELEDRVVAAATGDRAYPGTYPETGPRRRWLTAASLVAASLVVVVLVVAAIQLLPTEPEEPGLGDVEPISFGVRPEGVSADGEVVAHTWGTEVLLRVEGLEEGERYAVDVIDEAGTRVSAGTLIGDADVPVECALNGAVLRENAAAISVRDSEGAVVLRSDLATRR